MSSDWIVPIIIMGVLAWGMLQGTPVYDSFVRGAGRGIKTAVSVLPCLAAVMVAVETHDKVQLFRSSRRFSPGFHAWMDPFFLPRSDQ